MADLVTELAAQGRLVPPEERVRLPELLPESLQEAPSSEIDDAWNKEIARRVAAHERGEGRLHELDEVMADAARIAP